MINQNKQKKIIENRSQNLRFCERNLHTPSTKIPAVHLRNSLKTFLHGSKFHQSHIPIITTRQNFNLFHPTKPPKLPPQSLHITTLSPQ